jgi:hypothetical protein
MYGLKKTIDLGFLMDREVGQVAIGMYQVVFSFDEDVTIAVEGEFCDVEGFCFRKLLK